MSVSTHKVQNKGKFNNHSLKGVAGARHVAYIPTTTLMI